MYAYIHDTYLPTCPPTYLPTHLATWPPSHRYVPSTGQCSHLRSFQLVLSATGKMWVLHIWGLPRPVLNH